MASLPRWNEESELMKGFHILDIGFACFVIIFAILYMISGFKKEVWISDCDCSTGCMFICHGIRFWKNNKKWALFYIITGNFCLMVGFM